MPNSGLSHLLESLRRGLPLPGNDLVPDAELLSRFVATRDEAAFELLVRRHGPMIYGVARRILGDSHAADDVLQATMLTLVRQAKSLRRKSALPAWLYRVTVRIAHKAKANGDVKAATISESAGPVETAERAELRGIIDDAVERLPEKLRRAVILCYLGGYSCDDAAQILGCPRGTILSRLSAARERLRDDLAGCGVTIPAAALAATLTVELHCSALTPQLISLAIGVARTAAVLSPTVLTLAQGAIVMSWTKIAAATIAVLSISAVGVGLLRPAVEPQEEAKPPVAFADTMKGQELAREEKVATAEYRLQQHLRQFGDRRIELKMRIHEAEQRIKTLSEGISVFESSGDVQAYMLAFELDPKEGFGLVRDLKLQAEVITKSQRLREEAQKKLFTVQEELRILEEMAALRSEMLKRDVLRLHENG